MPLSDYTCHIRCFNGTECDVYVRGQGPPIIIAHETPNAHPLVFEFGDALVEEGFQVWIPSLFGEVGKPFRHLSALRFLVKSCIWKEFSVLASSRSSPLTEWLRGLGNELHQINDCGIGLIGMCITGNFALALCDEDWMMAPVLSQPSLPFALSPKLSSSLHVSNEIIESAKRRTDFQVLGLRFSHDRMCPASRFETLKAHFKDGFHGIEIDSGPNNTHGIPRTAHSVLTLDRIAKEGHPTHEAFKECLRFLKKRLQKPASTNHE